METRFEFKDFLKVFGFAILLYVVFEGLFQLIPSAGSFLSTVHPSVSFLIKYLLQFVILFCPLWIFVVEKYNSGPADFGFRKIPFKKVALTVLLSYLFYLAIIVCISLLLSYTGENIPGYEQQESYLPLFGQDWSGIVIGFVLVGLVAPILEEVLFRGFVYQIFVKTWPRWIGSILSAALFALIHIQFQTFIPLFILGLLLNRAYSKTGSLWSSIAFHSLNNILAFGVEVYLSLHPGTVASIAHLSQLLYTVQIG